MFEATPQAVRELTRLRNWGKKRLIPKLKAPYHFGPTFDLSTPGGAQRIAAEADLIANGSLIEIKTTLGALGSDGERPDALKAETLYQLLAYTLLDRSDTYEISKIGVYSARYGHLHEWPLEYVLSTAAGRSFDLAAAREHVWGLMHEERHLI